MAPRRGKGEGSIRHRKDGRYEARIDLGRGLNGKRRRKSVFGKTQAAVVRTLKRLHSNTVLTTSTPRVDAYLTNWLATGLTINGIPWRPKTQKSYQDAVTLHLIPAFGHLRLEQLTPLVIQAWLTEQKQAHGARRRIVLAHAILRSALAEARRLQILAINPAEMVKVPKPTTKRAILPLTMDEARAFLVVADQHRLGALFSVGLACGLRIGEAAGVTWKDVDLGAGLLHIRQQLQVTGKGKTRRLELVALKTEQSHRTLELPAVCVEQLRKHRQRQLEERLKAGAKWVETGLVFTTYTHRGPGVRVGAPLDPRNVLRMLHMLLERAGLARRRFHDLRHSAASLLLASGVQLAEVSKLLGHAELRLSADLYSHLQTQTSATAARHMERLLWAPKV